MSCLKKQQLFQGSAHDHTCERRRGARIRVLSATSSDAYVRTGTCLGPTSPCDAERDLDIASKPCGAFSQTHPDYAFDKLVIPKRTLPTSVNRTFASSSLEPLVARNAFAISSGYYYYYYYYYY